MTLCPYCEDTNLDDTGKCPECGNRYWICSICGKALDPDYTYPVEHSLENSEYDIYDMEPYCRECYQSKKTPKEIVEAEK